MNTYSISTKPHITLRTQSSVKLSAVVFIFPSYPWKNKQQFPQKNQLLSKMGRKYKFSLVTSFLITPPLASIPSAHTVFPACTENSQMSHVVWNLFYSQMEGIRHLAICFSALLNITLVAYTQSLVQISSTFSGIK